MFWVYRKISIRQIATLDLPRLVRYAKSMTKLPQGVKLIDKPGAGYEVVLNGSPLGTVYQRDLTYNISPKAFTLRWWEAKLPFNPYALGVDPERIRQGLSVRDQATKFDTRTLAIHALILLSSPTLERTKDELHGSLPIS